MSVMLAGVSNNGKVQLTEIPRACCMHATRMISLQDVTVVAVAIQDVKRQNAKASVTSSTLSLVECEVGNTY